jgi:hypothetical protein
MRRLLPSPDLPYKGDGSGYRTQANIAFLVINIAEASQT